MFVLVTQKEQQDLCAFTLLHTDPTTRQINHLRSHTATSWTRNRIEHFKKRWQTHSVWIWSCNVCTTHAPTCTHTHTEDYVRQVCVPGCRLRGPRKQLPLRAEPWEAREERDPTPFLGRRSAASSHPLTLWHHPPHLSPPSATEPGRFSINPAPLSFQSHVWSRETGGPSLTNPPTSEFGRVLGNMNPLCWDSPQNQILNRLWLFSVCTNQNTDIKIVQVKTKIIHSLLREVNRN